MAIARWMGEIIAKSDDTILVEGNHYFPRDSVNPILLRRSEASTVCPWKGTASYYDIVIGDQVNANAAWYYPDPRPAAAAIRDRIAFWKGVEVG